MMIDFIFGLQTYILLEDVNVIISIRKADAYVFYLKIKTASICAPAVDFIIAIAQEIPMDLKLI